MTEKQRLDAELVSRGIIQSRERAKAEIMAGKVYVNGQKADKAGELVTPEDNIEFRGEQLKYVSRGGLKLEKAMEDLISNNKGLIWSIINRFKDRGYEVEDLYQIAVIGFIKCIKKFDPSFEVRLSTYAVPYILGEVKRFIRDDGPVKVSRSIKELAYKVIEVQKQYIQKNGKDIKIEEIAKILKTSKEEITLAMDTFNPVESIHSAAYCKDGDEISILDKLSTNIDEEGQIINKLAIKQLIEGLGKREKQIILLRYYKNKTQSEVAKVLGITQVQVSRLEKQILETMKRKIYK